MTRYLARMLFTLIFLIALCAGSLPNEAIIPMTGVMIALALAVAVVSNAAYINKKAASRAGTLKAARPADKADPLHPYYRGLKGNVKHV